jgi:hypothetical protein
VALPEYLIPYRYLNAFMFHKKTPKLQYISLCFDIFTWGNLNLVIQVIIGKFNSNLISLSFKRMPAWTGGDRSKSNRQGTAISLSGIGAEQSSCPPRRH